MSAAGPTRTVDPSRLSERSLDRDGTGGRQCVQEIEVSIGVAVLTLLGCSLVDWEGKWGSHEEVGPSRHG